MTELDPYNKQEIKDTYDAGQYGKGWSRPMTDEELDAQFPHRIQESDQDNASDADAVSPQQK